MTTFALDTNILSYLMKKDRQVLERIKEIVREDEDCVIPPVAYYEVKRGLLAVNSSKRIQLLDTLCRHFPVGEMNTAVWEEAARLYAILRKRGQALEDADLFIAAFCLINGYTLATNNTRHFEMIEGLQYTNWKA